MSDQRKCELDNQIFTVLFTGGATGGHLYPAVALADKILTYGNTRIGFAGSGKGLEARVIPEKGYPFYRVWISGIQRKRFISNILLPLKIIVSLLQASVIILSFKPDVIVGTGGYVSWPVLMMSILLRKRTVIQEQNQFPGLVTRLIAPFADSVHLSFESSRKYFRKKDNLQVSGNPTRSDLEIKNKKQSYSLFRLDEHRITLFILGGSQGSLFINKTILKNLSGLLKYSEIQILWTTGDRWYEWIKRETEGFSRIKILPFITKIGHAYSICDLLICRAGATTIAEITTLGIPTVFIPLSTSAADHQVYNAKMLVDSQAAEMIPEDLVDNRFMEVISSLLNDKEKRKSMGQKAKSFSKPQAAENIVRDILRR